MKSSWAQPKADSDQHGAPMGGWVSYCSFYSWSWAVQLHVIQIYCVHQSKIMSGFGPSRASQYSMISWPISRSQQYLQSQGGSTKGGEREPTRSTMFWIFSALKKLETKQCLDGSIIITYHKHRKIMVARSLFNAPEFQLFVFVLWTGSTTIMEIACRKHPMVKWFQTGPQDKATKTEQWE